MNRLILIPLLAASSLVAQAETYVDTARVRSVQPQYDSISVPRRQCNTRLVHETQRVDTPRHYGGAVLGGIAGGLLGNQVGGGHGREAATALGAVIGAFTGDHVANRGRDAGRYETVAREVQNCRTVNEVQQRLTGYRVSYDYRGQQFTTFLPQDPGPHLRVRVSVDPVAH